MRIVTDDPKTATWLGLPFGVVALAAPDPSWQALGEDERTTIATALGDLALDVQHVGSTAVPGLDAKPIGR